MTSRRSPGSLTLTLTLTLTSIACTGPAPSDPIDGGASRDARAVGDGASSNDAGSPTDARPSLDAERDAAASDAANSDAATSDAAIDEDASLRPPAESCLYGIDPHPCDGSGFWTCDAGPTPVIGESRGEYVRTTCTDGEECIERRGGAPPVQGYCEPRDRECDRFAPSYCGDDGRVRYCVDGHWESDDTCGAAGAPYRCASVAGDPERWRCVDAPLVACDPAAYASHCADGVAVECETVGYVRSIACAGSRPACVTGFGHAACTVEGAASCDPVEDPFACSARDPEIVLACTPTGHLTPVLRCLRTPDAEDCTCAPTAILPSADAHCLPTSGSDSICATAWLSD